MRGGGSRSGFCDFGLELTFIYLFILLKLAQESNIGNLFILLNSDLKMEPIKNTLKNRGTFF
jgi:hypothetical protein